MANNLLRLMTDPGFRFDLLTSRNVLFWMSDKQVIEKKYYYRFGVKPNLNHPATYNEKLQWLKLNDRRPVYTQMVDKHEAKAFIAEKIGDAYVVPTLGVWDRFDDIDFEQLPDRFVLKCTHDSGGIVICRDKSKLDIARARKKIEKSMGRNYYYVGREWPYKNVKPRIIAEEFLEDAGDSELRDYKFFTFGGVPRVVYITQGRAAAGRTTADFFDMDFNHLDMKMDHDHAPIPPHPPKNFEQMKELAAVLSQGIPQLRVDFYEVNGRVYVGELTFFHCGGMVSVKPDSWARRFSDWIQLPNNEQGAFVK